MGLGISFSIVIVIGYLVREGVSAVYFNSSKNRLRSKITGKIAQIIAVTVTSLIVAPLTIDIIGIGLSALYIVFLLIDLWIAEKILVNLKKLQMYILELEYTKKLIAKYHAMHAHRKALSMEYHEDPKKAIPSSSLSPEPTRKTWLIYIQIFVVFSVKVVIYQAVIKTVVAGTSIAILTFFEKFADIALETFVQVVFGDLAVYLGKGCAFVFLSVPRIVIEWIIDMLDNFFDLF